MKKTTEKRPYEKPLMRAVEIQTEQLLTTSIETMSSGGTYTEED